MKKTAILALLVLLAATAAFAGDGLIHKNAGRQQVKDSYIVIFNNDGTDPGQRATDLARTHGGKAKRVYSHALRGAHFEMSEGQAQGMANNPHVALVVQDSLAYIVGDQSNPTWGIDRIDERDLPDDNNYHWDYDGTGVRAYILDTGIRTTHNNFGGRASWATDCTGEGTYDGHGHGTHVAGTVGSTTYGVAKNVSLYAVKICTSGGSCPGSAILCGIDYVTQQKQNNPSIPMVANMSVGGSYDSTENTAVNNSVNAGVFYAVAAGNDNANACNYSPASAANAYTIGSTTSSDYRSSFSNYGTCLDIFAPGSSILSTYNSSDTSTTTMSGTSMASPHACGAGALVFDEHPTWTPFQVMNELDARATTGRLYSIGTGSPNMLLYTLADSGCVPTEDPEVSCSDGLDNDCDGYIDGADPDCGSGNELQNGVPVTGLSASTGASLNYTMDVPAGATNLVFTTTGSDPDADLYVKFGSAPTRSSYDCRSWSSSSNETCNIGTAQAGTYYVMVYAYSSFTGLTLQGSYTTGGSCGDSASYSNLSGSTGSEQRFTFDVASCASTATFEISGGSGDADLYVNFGSTATTSNWDCRPYLWGNNETCTFTPPSTGTYHVMIRAYSSFSGVLLEMSYE